jgi:4'-phosphopantetheinyl transferase
VISTTASEPAVRPLAPGIVDVVRAPLEVDHPTLYQLSGLLDGGERMRAARFRFRRDATRFVVARGWLRHLLGGYLDMPPGQVEIRYGSHGKPSLAGSNQTDLRFNVSHTHDTMLVAVARGREVGVDIERLDEKADVSVAGHFFSKREVNALARLSARDRPEAFLRCWTRKEAFVKACGQGLSIPLDAFDVSLEEADDDALVDIRFDVPSGPDGWRVRDIGAGWHGHTAAVCAAGRDWRANTYEIGQREGAAA